MTHNATREETLAAICSMVEANFTDAIDQAHNYGSLQESLDAYKQNVIDTVEEQFGDEDWLQMNWHHALWKWEDLMAQREAEARG